MVVVTELVGGCHTQSWVAGLRLNIILVVVLRLNIILVSVVGVEY